MEVHGNRPTSLLPLAIVEQRTGYRKSKLYDLLKVGSFPRPVRDGRTIRFVEREVDQWVAARIAERDAALLDKPALLTETEKAAELGCSVSYLQKDRAKTCPAVPFIRVGPHVRYSPGALQAVVS
jgi:prophage regulatory protein